MVDRIAISDTLPTLPGTPVNMGRHMIEVSLNGDSTEIQNDIDTAATWLTNHPSEQSELVHVPYGNHSITQTLQVPANKDIQLVGDCGGTNFVWAGLTGGPMWVARTGQQSNDQGYPVRLWHDRRCRCHRR